MSLNRSERITVRIPASLMKVLDGYAAATGKDRSEAARFAMERGFDRLLRRYTWADQRTDIVRVMRPLLDRVAEEASALKEDIATRFGNLITDQIAIRLASMNDQITEIEFMREEIDRQVGELTDTLSAGGIGDRRYAVMMAKSFGFLQAICEAQGSKTYQRGLELGEGYVKKLQLNQEASNGPDNGGK